MGPSGAPWLSSGYVGSSQCPRGPAGLYGGFCECWRLSQSLSVLFPGAPQRGYRGAFGYVRAGSKHLLYVDEKISNNRCLES